jgi:ssDNA-binding Zn-finger/Zn-ribbon topoisomerase 1
MATAPKERAEISDDEEWEVAAELARGVSGVSGVSEIAQPDAPGPGPVEVTLRRLANTINEQQSRLEQLEREKSDKRVAAAVRGLEGHLVKGLTCATCQNDMCTRLNSRNGNVFAGCVKFPACRFTLQQWGSKEDMLKTLKAKMQQQQQKVDTKGGDMAPARSKSETFKCPMCDAMTGKRAGNQYATWKKCMDSQCYYKWETASRCEVKVNGPTSGSATSAADPNLLETVKAVAGWQRIVLWILRVDQQRIKDLEAIKHWRVRRQEAAEAAMLA